MREAVAGLTPSPFIVGLATHDATEFAAASLDPAVDYCTIGPLRESPGKLPLGEVALRRILEDVRGRTAPCPYLVLGGVGPGDALTIAGLSREGERWGLAAIRAFQDAGDDEAITRSASRMRDAIDSWTPPAE